MTWTFRIVLFLAVCVILPFVLWGDTIESWIGADSENGMLAAHARYAWIIGIALLIGDLLIPIPTTSIIAGLGVIYGPFVGALIAIVGSMMSALIGYAAGRWLGRPAVTRLFGASLDNGEQLFLRHGGWIVAASRWLPVLPEVVSVIAGVHRMPMIVFSIAAFCGIVPFSLAFAALGQLGADYPVVTLVIAAIIPILLWFGISRTGLLSRLVNSDH